MGLSDRISAIFRRTGDDTPARKLRYLPVTDIFCDLGQEELMEIAHAATMDLPMRCRTPKATALAGCNINRICGDLPRAAVASFGIHDRILHAVAPYLIPNACPIPA
jgi:hypothetical protein